MSRDRESRGRGIRTGGLGSATSIQFLDQEAGPAVEDVHFGDTR